MFAVSQIESPNYSDRAGAPIDLVVLHYTASGSAQGTARWFADPISRVSAHFVLGRQGELIQCVALKDAAWHCGVADVVLSGEAYSNCNQRSIGIELANCGLLEQVGGSWTYPVGDEHWPYLGGEPQEAGMIYDNGVAIEGHWEPYPEAQIDALQRLLWKLNELHPTAVQNLIGHEEIAMPLGRKKDPGPLFPWERFSRKLGRRTKRVC